MGNDILARIKQAVLDYDEKQSAILTGAALEQGLPPLEVMEALIEAVREVGDAFGQGTLFLPELIGAAEALQSATPLIEKEIVRLGQSRVSLGSVVVGTVAGDIHTIGKSMVVSLLMAEGFDVHDLGIDVSAERFIQAVRDHDAQILSMSALLTTTAPQCQVVIDDLTKAGLRDKVMVMVGGGAITAAFAQGMGADGYKPTAPGAVQLAREWVGM
jgi:methanogenic corrinoid protein MtbC1